MRKPSLTERASGARHAQEKWCRGRFPQSSQVLQRDFLQKKTPHKSGSDSSTSSNDSERPSQIIPRISVAVFKKIWFWLQNVKVVIILHAMDGICWNPHARKRSQGRSGRGPIIPQKFWGSASGEILQFGKKSSSLASSVSLCFLPFLWGYFLPSGLLLTVVFRKKQIFLTILTRTGL